MKQVLLLMLTALMMLACGQQSNAETASEQKKQRRAHSQERRMGSFPAGCAVCDDILPVERHVLFRNAYPHVGNGSDGLSASGGLCHCHNPACTHRGMAPGV